MEYDKAGRVVTFQSWKLISIEKPYSIAERLQWSHDISVMETSNTSLFLLFPFLTFNGAMTFLSWKPSTGAPSIFSIAAFNGAMIFLSWKHDLCCQVGVFLLTFNGAMIFLSWKPGSSFFFVSPFSASMEP